MNDEILIEKLRNYGADVKGIEGRFMGNYKLYNTCFGDLFNDPNFDNLENAVANKKYDEAFLAAHAMKGLTGNLGLTPLYQAFCDLVECLRSKNYKDVKSLYKKVKSEIDKVKKL